MPHFDHRPAPLVGGLEDALAHALADELVLLSRDLGRLAAELGSDAATLRRHMNSLQSIDRITQVHDALATVLRGGGTSEERLAALLLEDLHGRLRDRLAAHRNGAVSGAAAAPSPPLPPGSASGLRDDERHPVKADIHVAVNGGPPVLLSVCDVSRGGIGTDGLTQPPLGARLDIEFPDGRRTTGCAVWRDGFTSGIRFERMLSFAELEALRRSLLAHPHFGIDR